MEKQLGIQISLDTSYDIAKTNVPDRYKKQRRILRVNPAHTVSQEGPMPLIVTSIWPGNYRSPGRDLISTSPL